MSAAAHAVLRIRTRTVIPYIDLPNYTVTNFLSGTQLSLLVLFVFKIVYAVQSKYILVYDSILILITFIRQKLKNKEQLTDGER